MGAAQVVSGFGYGEARWLCEAADAERESWMSDAPWAMANERHGHSYLVRTREGVQKAFAGMAFVKRADLVSQLFYGNPVADPTQMTGFSTYYSTRDPANAQNAVCVINGDEGVGNLTSIWAIAWGPATIFMITPDGSPPVHSGELGLVVADWRFAVRIANVSLKEDRKGIETLIDRALVQLPVHPSDGRNVRTTIYMNEGMAMKVPLNHYRKTFIRVAPIGEDEARIF